MRIAIMQPTYLPWAGYFDLMDQVDIFVVLNNVQFEKRSWQQRNRIKGPQGLQMLTVPVSTRARFEQRIVDTQLAEKTFGQQHLASIAHAYGKAPFLRRYLEPFSATLLKGIESGMLEDVNVSTIRWIAESSSVITPILRASDMKAVGKRASLLAAICQELGATEYLSPAGSTGYLAKEHDVFDAHGIEILIQDYHPAPYPQQYPPFIPYASAIDVLFNTGDGALEVIRAGRRPSVPLQEWLARHPVPASAEEAPQ